MAQDFAEWLQNAAFNSGVESDKTILIVGVTGRSDCRTAKCEFIDKLVDKAIFCGRYGSAEMINIDAYYSQHHQIVFLYLNSYHDGDVQLKLFSSGKPFFEALATAESTFIKFLFLLFVVSHVVVFIQADSRIDTVLVRHLVAVNEMRNQSRNLLSQKFRSIPNFGSIWKEEGRVALPRLLFVMRDRPVRPPKVPTDAKKSNDTERLERSREYQVVHIMRRMQITAEHLGIALASLTPHRTPFVHILQPDENESDVVTTNLTRLFLGEILYNELIPAVESRLSPSSDSMTASAFILGHVKDIVKNEGNLPYFFILPKLKTFIDGAKVVHNAVTTNGLFSQQLIKNWLSEELHFINDYNTQMVQYSFELYNRLTTNYNIGKMFYDPDLTESKHFRAVQYCAAFLRVCLNDTALKEAWPRLTRFAAARFRLRRNRCNSNSISGIRCHLLTHKVPSQYTPGQTMDDAFAFRGRSYPHCSGYSYTSTCSCGRTQKKRLDPYSAKEANYDFYSTFPCCAKAECMPFKLYNPGIKWDMSRTISVVVNKKGDKEQSKYRLLSRKNAAEEEEDKYSTYTVVKHKTQNQIVSELLWQYNQMVHEHKGRYLATMWHSSNTDKDLTPLYPSWSVICIGPAKLYIHSKGIGNDQPGFLRGTDFLLPWDVQLTVQSGKWNTGMKEISKADRVPFKERERRLDKNSEENTHRERLKGHRFMCSSRAPTKSDAVSLISSKLPVYIPCRCSAARAPMVAQLMRLHIVTPKAPIGVKVYPLVSDTGTGHFNMGQSAELNWGRYYVLRFPFVYENPDGTLLKQLDTVENSPYLMPNCISVYQKLSD